MAVMRVPVVKVRLDFGDGSKPITIASSLNLISATCQEGEQDRSNSAQIVLDDPGLEIAKLLRNRALKAGAIAVPKTLLEKDETIAGAASPVPASNKDLPKDGKPGSDLSAYIGGTAEISLPAEYRAWLDVIAWCEGSGYNTIVGYVDTIKDFSVHPKRLVPGLSDAAGRYQIKSDTWGEVAQPDFGPQNQDLAAVKLIKRRGMDSAVMAGLGGADRFMDECSWEWASIPNSAGNHRYSGQGSKTPQMVRDALAVALNYYKVGGVTKSPTAQSAGQIAPGTALSGPALLASQLVAANPTAQPQETTPKEAIELSIEMGWSDETATVVSTLWYTSHSLSTSLPTRTTIGGQGLRYLISQGDRARKIWENISLRQIADRIGSKYGVNVSIPSTPASEKIVQVLAQKGQTDYQFLAEVAAASGFLIKETIVNGQKVLQFVSAAEKGGEVFKVDRAWGATFSSSESADAERLVKTLPSILSIDDGKAIGDGFVTKVTIAAPTVKTMGIQPGAIVEIPKGAIASLPEDSAFCREYRVKANQRSYAAGKLTQVLTLYIPVHTTPPKSATGTGTAANPTGAQSKVAAKPPNRNGRFMFLAANGAIETESGLNLMTLALVDNNAIVDSVLAVSGQLYAQNLSLANQSGSGAPLPPNKAGYQLINGESSSSSLGTGLGKYWIEVANVPGRGAIGIHEDSNRPGGSEGGTAYGTIGCVGVIGEGNMAKVYNWYTSGVNWLVVDFDNFITT